jgi:DedD protein
MLIEGPVERRSLSDHTIPAKPAVKESMPEQGVQQQREVKPRPVPSVTKPTSQKTPMPEPTVTQEVKPPEPKPVETTTNASTKTSPTAWMIQVASLTNEENAEKLVERLRKEDLPAQMEKVRLNGKLHYRIRVGPEVDRRLAEKMLAKIKQVFKLNPKLMRYPE